MVTGDIALRPMGERAVLAEVADLASVLTLHAALAADVPDGIDDLVPAARTVLVVFDPRRITPAAVRTWIASRAGRTPDAIAPGSLVEVPVRYDGADLHSTAEILGIPVSDLVARHAGVEWTVAFTGFAPGFAYLVSAGWPYDVPRLAEPRTRVPAGAVGLAGGFSGAYPRETPGGWRLIGTTDAALFAPDAATPVLLPPQARVRFVPEPGRIAAAREDPAGIAREGRGARDGTPVAHPGSGGLPGGGGADAAAVSSPPGISSAAKTSADLGTDAGAGADACEGAEPIAVPAPVASPAPPASAEPIAVPAPPASADPSRPALRVLAAGAFTTVQDLGRPGRAALGVSRSGALDRAALRIGNRLLGNDEGAAALEIVMGGFTARAETDTWVCVTGGLAEIGVDGRPVSAYAPQRVPAGAEVHIGPVTAGLRAYLAVRGGVVAPAALGSRARDVLAGLGPDPVRAGDVLSVGTTASAIPVLDVFPWSVPGPLIEVPIAAGPRADRFAPEAFGTLGAAMWTVSSHADRVGVRLDGPELVRARHDELPSEGMRPGAIQVPPHGRPVVLLADGPVTGGYPVIAVVTDAAIDALGQARPGDRVRFRGV
ncbi:urea amidolyase family protein [Microbacterium enclense]|uniref:Sensor histidine kinase inhibitor, KipI family n=1 Tax=Microbacterium enclense TaxID=993073 RepID=A0A1G6GR90_9MICO|nr:urea amidolyase family protein [Microbacterium enclense]SDB84461.1 sensor histidine kinase inhibitor, KipI family [Microbacterium enclense]